MADDNMDSDACIGSKRRISDIEETPILVLEQHQEISTVSTNQEDNDSKESYFSSPKEDQQFIQDLPSPSKKVKSSLALLEDNEEIFDSCSQENVVLSGSFVCDVSSEDYSRKVGNFDSQLQGTEHNQQIFDSCSQEKVVLCDLASGSFVCDGNSENDSKEVGNFDVQLQETKENEEMLGSCSQENALFCDLVSGSFVCDVNSDDFSRKAGNLDVQSQETKNFVFVGEDNQGEVEETVNGVKSEVGLSAVQEFDKHVAFEVEKGSGVEEKKEILLEAKKKQLLAKLEDASVFEGKNHVGNSLGLDTTAGILLDLKGIDVEVIDDIAVIGTVPVTKTGNPGVRNAERTIKKSDKQEVDGKKAKRPRRKKKNAKKGLVISDGQKEMIQAGKYHNGDKKNGDQMRKYSREEMEALRFVNTVEQRKLWRVIYIGLGDAVMKEYDDLASSRHHQKNFHMNFDPRKRVGRMEDASGIHGEVCCENGDKLENMKVDEVENVNLSGPSCSESIGGEDDSTEGEDSDEDYGSIQRPAFLVEGEPDFNSGPPEDGLEYLRRVRWEAAHIPKVKVAKLDKSKVNKEQSIYMPQIPEIAKCPEQLLPLKQWEDAFLADFSELRMYLSHNADAGMEISYKLQSSDIVHEQNTSSPHLDEDAIIEKFNNLRTDEVHSYNLLDDSCPDNTIDQASGNTSVSDSSCNYPTVSAILAMDSVSRVSMLRKRIRLAETMNTLSKNDCMWLFALCAAVDTPLDADTSAALRSLLRKCAGMRAAKSELDDEVIMLNILITISGRYFGQSES